MYYYAERWALLCWRHCGAFVVNMKLREPVRFKTGSRVTSAILMVAFLAIAAWIFLQREPQTNFAGQGFAVDGDSLRIGADRIRLAGLDAPEYEQECHDANGAPWPCGLRARDELADLLAGGDLSCVANGRDQYGRALAICFRGDTNIGSEMVGRGLAVADGEFLTEQSAARTNLVGIWQGEFMDPAEWRRGARSSGQDEEPLSGILDGLFH